MIVIAKIEIAAGIFKRQKDHAETPIYEVERMLLQMYEHCLTHSGKFTLTHTLSGEITAELADEE